MMINGYHVMNVEIRFQYMKHETFTDSKIKDSVETTDNPFESESTVLSIDNRAQQRSKGRKPRSKRLKTEEHEDAEIQAELNKGNTVRIIQDI